jgi:hypothetical protein
MASYSDPQMALPPFLRCGKLDTLSLSHLQDRAGGWGEGPGSSRILDCQNRGVLAEQSLAERSDNGGIYHKDKDRSKRIYGGCRLSLDGRGARWKSRRSFAAAGSISIPNFHSRGPRTVSDLRGVRESPKLKPKFRRPQTLRTFSKYCRRQGIGAFE